MKRKPHFPKPDILLKTVKLRHVADNQELLRKLEKSLRKEGWTNRPLLVLCTKAGVYETVTGCHRAKAAMNVRIKIPCICIPKAQFKSANRMEYSSLATLLKEKRLRKAATLALLEVRFGSTGPSVKPLIKPRTGGDKRFKAVLVAQDIEKPREQ
jgi:hypothetical protein